MSLTREGAMAAFVRSVQAGRMVRAAPTRDDWPAGVCSTASMQRPSAHRTLSTLSFDFMMPALSMNRRSRN
jgi:hypothetical protein